jgi:glucose-1-phosphate cytidylyltransferase
MEKPSGDGAWINGGFFVCEPEVFNYIENKDSVILEREPFERLAKDGRMNAFKHRGFWQPMDTMKDKNMLTELWVKNNAPWAKWLNAGG